MDLGLRRQMDIPSVKERWTSGLDYFRHVHAEAFQDMAAKVRYLGRCRQWL